MRIIRIFAFSAAFMACQQANAADFFSQYNQNRVAQAWQGLYVGAHIGHSWANYEATVTPGPVALDFSGSGFNFGAFAGYNTSWMSNLVTGVEADITFGGPDGAQVVGPSTYVGDSNWSASMRGRLGFTFDQFLVYGTLGLAFGGVEFNNPLTGAGDAVKIGWVAGAGVEAHVIDNWILRAEYLYTSFGSGTYALGPLTASDADVSSHTLRVGVGYQF